MGRGHFIYFAKHSQGPPTQTQSNLQAIIGLSVSLVETLSLLPVHKKPAEGSIKFPPFSMLRCLICFVKPG